MTSQNSSTHKIVKVYLRNQQKMAKILLFPQVIQTNELYQTASLSYNIPLHDIHLFYGGKKVETNSQITLTDNTIIHIVNLPQLQTEELVMIVKMIEGSGTTVTLKTNRNTLIKEFIDEKLSSVFGLKSDAIFLVHMGRQLCLEKTFKQEEVQTNCQLLCLNFQEQDSSDSINMARNQIKNDDNYVVSISMKQDLKSEQNQKTSKDIYPAPNFTIQVPEQMQVESTFNHLNLIFDSKVRRSSSIRGIDFTPDQIIAEEEDLSFVQRHSYKSEMSQKPHQKSNISRYSEHQGESVIDHNHLYEKSHTKLSRYQQRKSKGQNGEICILDGQIGRSHVSEQVKLRKRQSQK